MKTDLLSEALREALMIILTDAPPVDTKRERNDHVWSTMKSVL